MTTILVLNKVTVSKNIYWMYILGVFFNVRMALKSRLCRHHSNCFWLLFCFLLQYMFTTVQMTLKSCNHRKCWGVKQYDFSLYTASGSPSNSLDVVLTVVHLFLVQYTMLWLLLLWFRPQARTSWPGRWHRRSRGCLNNLLIVIMLFLFSFYTFKSRSFLFTKPVLNIKHSVTIFKYTKNDGIA